MRMPIMIHSNFDLYITAVHLIILYTYWKLIQVAHKISSIKMKLFIPAFKLIKLF